MTLLALYDSTCMTLLALHDSTCIACYNKSDYLTGLKKSNLVTAKQQIRLSYM